MGYREHEELLFRVCVNGRVLDGAAQYGQVASVRIAKRGAAAVALLIGYPHLSAGVTATGRIPNCAEIARAVATCSETTG